MFGNLKFGVLADTRVHRQFTLFCVKRGSSLVQLPGSSRGQGNLTEPPAATHPGGLDATMHEESMRIFPRTVQAQSAHTRLSPFPRLHAKLKLPLSAPFGTRRA